MGKKGTDGRRTSGITPTQVMNELSRHGFSLATEGRGESTPSTAFRKKVHATQNHFRTQVYKQEAAAAQRAKEEAAKIQAAGGQVAAAKDTPVRRQEIATSRSGRSIRMIRDDLTILLPVDNHMTDNALKAIQQKTGVDLGHLQQLQHKRIF